MFKNINYNNVSQKRLTKFALIKYRINFRNYSIIIIFLYQTTIKTNILIMTTAIFMANMITIRVYGITSRDMIQTNDKKNK